MSVFRSRPALRWLVPSAAAVVVIGGGAAAGTIAASADPTLPERSAAQLLVDVQNAKVDGLSGTVVQTRRPRPAALRGRHRRAGRRRSDPLDRGQQHRCGSGTPVRTRYGSRCSGTLRRDRRDPQRPGRVDVAQPGQHGHAT